jgi:hypothetical protein
MISYDVLTRAIADWKAGVRPALGSGPHHTAGTAPVYDYAADGAAGYAADAAPYAADAGAQAEDTVYEEAGAEEIAEEIEDVASGIVDVEEP